MFSRVKPKPHWVPLHLLFIHFSACIPDYRLKIPDYSQILNLMGSRFEIKAIAQSEEEARIAVELAIEEIKRIESMISSWDENSHRHLRLTNTAGESNQSK